jgi:hypothetical protein
MEEVMLLTLWSIRMFRSQEVTVLDSLDSDHLIIMFTIQAPLKGRKVLDPVDKYKNRVVSKSELQSSMAENPN